MSVANRWIAGGLIAAAFTLGAVATPAYAQNNAVKSGVDAWQAGNYAAAVNSWRPQAEQGDPDAQFNMGQAYKLGRGVPSDLRLAQTWYEKAAQQGHEQAQANLGLILFQNGDREAAMPWIRKAADFGDPRAQYVLGTALFNGDLVGKDYPRAYALMNRAAAQGLPQAATTVTEMDGLIPLADRQKGIALAQEMERGQAAAAAAPAPAPATPIRPAPPTRVASAATAAPPPRPVAPAPRVVTPTPRPAVSTAKPVPTEPKPVVAAPKPAPRPAATSLASAGGRWRVQLGAYGSPEGARGEWGTLSKRIAALSGLRPSYEPVGKLTRLRVGPLADRAAADRLCAAAKAAGQACIPIAP